MTSPEVKGHTPGPWQIRTLENFGFNVVHYVGGDKFDISLVAKVGEDANARLIAAAPDLLAALEQSVLYVETLHSLMIADGRTSPATKALMRNIKASRAAISRTGAA